MIECQDFVVWACGAGVVHIKSGPFQFYLPKGQAIRLANTIIEAAKTITPEPKYNGPNLYSLDTVRGEV